MGVRQSSLKSLGVPAAARLSQSIRKPSSNAKLACALAFDDEAASCLESKQVEARQLNRSTLNIPAPCIACEVPD